MRCDMPHGLYRFRGRLHQRRRRLLQRLPVHHRNVPMRPDRHLLHGRRPMLPGVLHERAVQQLSPAGRAVRRQQPVLFRSRLLGERSLRQTPAELHAGGTRAPLQYGLAILGFAARFVVE